MKITIPLSHHLEITGEVSENGSVTGVEFNQTLTPDNDAQPGQCSGDAFAFTLAPKVNISPHSCGPVGGNAHKWVGTLKMYLPRLQGGGETGKPQGLVGLLITDPPGTDVREEDALMGAWAVRVGTRLPTIFDGPVRVGKLRITNSPAPLSSTDPTGEEGEVRWDENYWYLKINSRRWARTAFDAPETW